MPWRTPLVIWNQSVVSCPILTVASWPAYRFLRRQVRWSDIPLFKNFQVYFDPHRQNVWCSQWSRSRCLSGSLLLFRWSNRCWQFDLWFLCLFWIQLVHLEVFSSCTVEPSLKDFEYNLAGLWNECFCIHSTCTHFQVLWADEGHVPASCCC